MNFRPLHDHLIVEQFIKEGEITRPSGLILMAGTEVQKSRTMVGKVISAGPGRQLDSGELSKMTVSVGDTVHFPTLAGWQFQTEESDEEFRIIKLTDVLFVED